MQPGEPNCEIYCASEKLLEFNFQLYCEKFLEKAYLLYSINVHIQSETHSILVTIYITVISSWHFGDQVLHRSNEQVTDINGESATMTH